MSKLLGFMSAYDEDDLCDCGHKALDHTPCCGACTYCGTRNCDEFDPAEASR